MRRAVATWCALYFTSIANACSIEPRYEPPVLMDQALAAGVVLKVRVIEEVTPADADEAQYDHRVRVEPLEYYKGSGPLEPIVVAGFTNSAACGIDPPLEPADEEGIVFACASGDDLMLNTIYPHTGYVLWSAENDATLRNYQGFIAASGQASSQGNFTAFQCSNVNNLYREIAPCGLPKGEPGLCQAAFERFTYNTQTNECEPFTYGGCGGSENNFESLEECRNACDPIGEQPREGSGSRMSFYASALTIGSAIAAVFIMFFAV